MSGPDSDFEQGVRLVRDSYLKKVSEKDTEIVHLRGECARKDAEIRDLQTRISQLEVQVARTDKRMAEMSRIITKLNSFKQSVIESFAGDEEYSHLKTNTSVGAAGATSNSGLNDLLNETLQYQSQSNARGSTSHPSYGGYAPSLGAGSQTNTRGASPNATHPRSLSRQPSHARAPSHLYIPNSHTANSHQLQQQQQQQQQQTTDEDPLSFDPQAAGTSYDAANAGNAPPASATHVHATPTSASKSNKAGTIDGRDFFKSARARLSYDEFTTLLWNVKAYNARDQSRSRTLENLKELFGEKYQDLYDQFERMLLGALNQST